MESNKFWNTLTNAITLPFDEDNVITVEENAGTTYIELEDGSTYYLDFQKCDDDNEDT